MKTRTFIKLKTFLSNAQALADVIGIIFDKTNCSTKIDWSLFTKAEINNETRTSDGSKFWRSNDLQTRSKNSDKVLKEMSFSWINGWKTCRHNSVSEIFLRPPDFIWMAIWSNKRQIRSIPTVSSVRQSRKRLKMTDLFNFRRSRNRNASSSFSNKGGVWSNRSSISLNFISQVQGSPQNIGSKNRQFWFFFSTFLSSKTYHSRPFRASITRFGWKKDIWDV